MKKIALALAAIAVLSTGAFAANKRTAELRDLQPASATVVNSAAFGVAADTGSLTAYDRQIMQQQFNEIGDN